MATLQSDGACSLDMSAYPGYYQDGHYDNTPATYISSYALAITGCIYALLLWRRRVKSEAALQHTRFWFCAKLVLMSVSVTLAGFVHHGLFDTTGDVQESTANKSLWFIGESLEIFSGSCGICAALAAVILVNARKHNVKAYIATVTLSCVSIIILPTCVGRDFFVAASLFGDVLANFVLVMCVLLWSCRHAVPVRLLKGKVALALAMILSCLGEYIQMAFGGVCGVPCPVDCPLPSPGFNHNATFHVVQIAALGLLACGMHKVCLCLEVQALRQHSQKPLASDVESVVLSVPSICEGLVDSSIVQKSKVDEPVPPELPRTMVLAADALEQLACDEAAKSKKEPASLSTLASSAPSRGPSRGSLARSLAKFVGTQSEAASSRLSSISSSRSSSSRASSLLTGSASSMLTGSSEVTLHASSRLSGSASSMLTGSSEVAVSSCTQLQ